MNKLDERFCGKCGTGRVGDDSLCRACGVWVRDDKAALATVTRISDHMAHQGRRVEAVDIEGCRFFAAGPGTDEVTFGVNDHCLLIASGRSAMARVTCRSAPLFGRAIHGGVHAPRPEPHPAQNSASAVFWR